MKIKVKLAEIIINQIPELYGEYATMEKGQTMIYIELLKAQYGLFLAAILFYKKLLGDIKK